MRYVDDTFAFIKKEHIDTVQKALNAFEAKIQFTYEIEKDNQLSFLDVLIEKNSNNRLITKVYRKKTNTDTYMNWLSHSPKSWKIGTLRSLLRRAYTISSTLQIAQEEISHLKNVFCTLNQYPPKDVDAIIKEEREKQSQKSAETSVNEANTNDKQEEKDQTIVSLTLPYGGEIGENIIRKFTKEAKKKLNKDTKIQITYKSHKLSEKFQIKDKTKFEHNHNVTYKVTCANKKCNSSYGGQTKCRIAKRMGEHNGNDKASHVWNHSKKTRHRRVWLNDVVILGKGYTNTFKRRISESLFIKEFKPNLNKQKDAYKLKLFN